MSKNGKITAKCDTRNKNTKFTITRFIVGEAVVPAEGNRPTGRGAKVIIQFTELAGSEVLPEVVPGKEYTITVS